MVTNSIKRGQKPEAPYLHPDLNQITIFPDLELVSLNKFSGAEPKGREPSMYIMGSRGCPFSCTFCQSYWGKKVRYLNPDHLVSIIENLHGKYGINEVFLQDDTFNLNLDWAHKVFTALMVRGLSETMSFKIVCRCDYKLINEDFLRAAKAAGVWMIFYGVESLDQQMLNSMKKNLNVDDILRAFKLTQKAGIKAHASLIVGMPGETKKTVENTYERLKQLQPDSFSFGPPTPFPNTELRKQLIESGHLLDSNYDNYSPERCVVRTEKLTPNDIAFVLRKFNELRRRHDCQ